MNVLDIIILVLLVTFLLLGRKQGLILTLAGLVVYLLALLGAPVIADRLAPQTAQIIEPYVIDMVQIQTENAKEQQPELTIEIDPETNPFLNEIVNSDFYRHFEEDVLQQADSAVQTAAENVARSIAQSLAWLLVYILSFLLICAVGRLLAQLLNTVALLPGLRLLNVNLGGLCGLLKGAVLSAVIVALGSGFGLISPQLLSDSFFARFLSGIQIVTL